MQLDSFTILVAGCSLLVLLGALFVFLWLRDRAAPWLLWWGIPFICSGAALTLYMRPGWDTEFLSISLGNAMRIFAVGCLWQGLRVFQHRRPALWSLAAICAVWIALCFHPAFLTAMAMRIAVVSLLNGGICLLAAYELWRDRDERLPSRWPTILVLLSFATLMFVRVAIVNIAPFPVGALPLDPAWLGIFMWVTFGHATFAAVLVIAMTKERREAEQRNFALSDPLTGLFNRRAFADYAAQLSRRSPGAQHSMALLVLDLDHFKQVNDRFGHEVGDRMLRAFAEIAERCTRPSDRLYRMGGEEFCFVMPDTNGTEAIALAERLRMNFEAAELPTDTGPAKATVSIGIAATHYAVDLDVLLAAADAAVYEAKARGRNRIVMAEPSSLLRASLSDVVGPARARA